MENPFKYLEEGMYFLLLVSMVGISMINII